MAHNVAFVLGVQHGNWTTPYFMLCTSCFLNMITVLQLSKLRNLRAIFCIVSTVPYLSVRQGMSLLQMPLKLIPLLYCFSCGSGFLDLTRVTWYLLPGLLGCSAVPPRPFFTPSSRQLCKTHLKTVLPRVTVAPHLEAQGWPPLHVTRPSSQPIWALP